MQDVDVVISNVFSSPMLILINPDLIRASSQPQSVDVFNKSSIILKGV